jgi:hypothetical protein
MTEHPTDPAITEAVQQIANRFGAEGLEEMIAAATEQLARTRAAYTELPGDG